MLLVCSRRWTAGRVATHLQDVGWVRFDAGQLPGRGLRCRVACPSTHIIHNWLSSGLSSGCAHSRGGPPGPGQLPAHCQRRTGVQLRFALAAPGILDLSPTVTSSHPTHTCTHQFRLWFDEEAKKGTVPAEGITMVLATASADGTPSARVRLVCGRFVAPVASPDGVEPQLERIDWLCR